MTSVVEQFADLTRYVEDNPGWTLVEGGPDDVPFATRQIRVTGEVCWTFQLRPQGDGLFRAFAAHQEQRTHVGLLPACRQWLDRKQAAAVKQQQQVEWLSEFARTRRGWRFVEADRGWKPFAVRTFDFPEVRDTDRVGLLLAWNARCALPFTATVQVEYADGPEAACTDGPDEVAAWLDERERTLKLPGKLRDCGSRQAASQLVDQAPTADVLRLANLFRWHGPANIRTQLADLFSQH